MSSPTELYLPQSFPYPIKVVSLDVNPAANVERGTRLLSYSFVHLPASPSAQPETRFGTWDASVEGTLDAWKVKKGDVISERRGREKPVVLITEPCKHGVQIGGLCGLCGKDMTDYDYTGFSDASRASIQMTHSAFGPTVSFEEAQRIERETAEHLLKSRKLSLIVDLDQTIVHATVDPTVGDWIAEGEAWEARQAQKAASASKHEGKDDSDDSDDTLSDSEDECNPNWEALKDVKKFRLGPESFGAPPSRNGKGKQKLENDGCMYYIKPRPGWKDFLRNIATKYEMHVYTMGTRAYAEEVCAAIDPDGKIFGGRLLSRDESGSLTQKSLQRLFPCDTSMVVIIDDRADVWEWSPNLLKVIPYDFFIGIGDINSSFLPKIQPITATVPSQQPPARSPAENSSASGSSPSPSSSQSPPPSPFSASTLGSDTTPPSSPSPSTSAGEISQDAMLTQNSAALEAQLEERPLARQQERLQDEADGDAEKASEEASAEQDRKGKGKERAEGADNVTTRTQSHTPEKHARKALLKNDDYELQRLSGLLEEVHSRFFSAYDSRSPNDKSKARRPRDPPPKVPYDVTSIIPAIRSEALQGVHILFSSVIPLDTRPEATEIWRMAYMFGATCTTELSSRVTHVVAAKRGTVKVDAARRRGGVHIVWLSWFTDSIALWRRQDETPYFLDDPPAPNTSSSAHQISSDPEPDSDDWDGTDDVDDADKGAAKGTGMDLELGTIDWNDINNEVDAAMNESDDDEDEEDETRSEKSTRSEDGSETNSNASHSTTSSPRHKRKRRSITPSNPTDPAEEGLRSPLAKRKRLAAERTGYSKLKEAISADEVGSVEKEGTEGDDASSIGGEDDEDEAEADDDDFLARELEEEWG